MSAIDHDVGQVDEMSVENNSVFSPGDWEVATQAARALVRLRDASEFVKPLVSYGRL